MQTHPNFRCYGAVFLLAGFLLLVMGYKGLQVLKFTFGLALDQPAFWLAGISLTCLFGLVLLVVPMVRLQRTAWAREMVGRQAPRRIVRAVAIGLVAATAAHFLAMLVDFLLGAVSLDDIAALLFLTGVELVILMLWCLILPIPVMILASWYQRLNRGAIVLLAMLAPVLLHLFFAIDFTTTEGSHSTFGGSLGTTNIDGMPTPLGWLTLFPDFWGIAAFGAIGGMVAARWLHADEAESPV